MQAFVRAISQFSVCLAGSSLVQLSALFVRACVILFVHLLLSFVRFVAFHSVTWLVRLSIVFSLKLPFM